MRGVLIDLIAMAGVVLFATGLAGWSWQLAAVAVGILLVVIAVALQLGVRTS